MKEQDKILRKLAKENNITVRQAEEIFHLFIQMIATTISDPDKKTEGLYDETKFKNIHIDNFGKFKLNKRNFRHANYCLEKKKNED